MTSSSVTKRDQVAETLRRQILTGELPRGTRLRQDELARLLSTSITPVREALRVLESEGLVRSEPHKGVRVAGLDLEKTKAIYIVRRLVESYAMQRATLRMTPLDLRRARRLLDEMRDALEQRDSVHFRELNRAFHFTYYERCGLPTLCEQIDNMWLAFPWDLSLDSLDRDEQSYREHVAMADAVEAGDVSTVASTTEAHIAAGFRSIVKRALGTEGEDPFDLTVD